MHHGETDDGAASWSPSDGWDTRYEWRAIGLLSLGFGLVAFDRFLILPMFPVIMRDLDLTYGDLGNITGALAITWGLSAFLMGRVSDRWGRRKIVVGSMVTFSLLVGLSGLATGAMSLILIRAMMGTAEGAYVPPSIAATLESARPDRHGLSLGLQQMTAPLLGLGLAPLLVTQLMQVIDWRWIFLVVALPGLIVAWLLHRTLRDPVVAAGRPIERPPVRDLLRHRNVPLAAIGMLCWLNCLIVLSAFLPSYLTDRLALSISQMGFVMSAMGVGAVVGSVIVPALSDRTGRKPAMLVSVTMAILALTMLARTGAAVPALFGWLLVASFFLYALLTLTVGPLSVESVPFALRATASGTVIAVGELFGGGLAPVIAGYVAHHFGIAYIFTLAIGGLLVGVLACLPLIETAPRVLTRRSIRLHRV
jgi:MFS family permease